MFPRRVNDSAMTCESPLTELPLSRCRGGPPRAGLLGQRAALLMGRGWGTEGSRRHFSPPPPSPSPAGPEGPRQGCPDGGRRAVTSGAPRQLVSRLLSR